MGIAEWIIEQQEMREDYLNFPDMTTEDNIRQCITMPQRQGVNYEAGVLQSMARKIQSWNEESRDPQWITYLTRTRGRRILNMNVSQEIRGEPSVLNSGGCVTGEIAALLMQLLSLLQVLQVRKMNKPKPHGHCTCNVKWHTKQGNRAN